MYSEQRIKATTKVTSDKCIYTWTIENYRLLKLKVGEKIESPNFGVGSNDKKYFQLWLYPAGDTKERAEEHLSLYLYPIIDFSSKRGKFVCRSTISAINGKKVVRQLILHHDFATTVFEGCGWAKYFELAKIDQLISSENTVTFQCELEIFDEIQSSLNSEIICSKDEVIETIKFDFSFLSEKFSDVKLIVEEQEIPAHKIVLSAASPVFRAMFTHDMLENEENSVKITDVSANIVTEMLRFIYTGQMDATETDTIIELLAVSDKYQIDSLKNKCGKMLCDDLSTENAIDILVASHKYKVKHLENEVIKFVTNHTQLLSNFEKMTKVDDPVIWVNLTQSILKSQKNVS
ncbi:speckle-type POZ protein B-like [Trichogramma pretiosum]|uniref:speckle-type POZ protein B-like n=1 Tax=Trichogramma pretiosum TaxID=7493 RepID=UPI000C71C52F|nr:speckle-type POZ protein B-like [Trichogramma pretiosum]